MHPNVNPAVHRLRNPDLIPLINIFSGQTLSDADDDDDGNKMQLD
jgi:hypothetical protein